jgi:hypothetical protein
LSSESPGTNLIHRQRGDTDRSTGSQNRQLNYQSSYHVKPNHCCSLALDCKKEQKSRYHMQAAKDQSLNWILVANIEGSN